MTVLISIPTDLNSLQREAIAIDVINHIVDRTKNGLDINNQPFASYKEGYKKTLDYKIGHGANASVNLTLTGEMLGSIQLVSHGPGFIKLGFENSESAQKAKWIQTPTGQKAGKQSPRRFFGINEKDLNRIVAKNRNEDVAFSTSAVSRSTGGLIRRVFGL